MKATEILVTEHKAVLVALEILHKIGEAIGVGNPNAPGDMEQLIDFFKVFVDRCHHGKEEDVLFPELENRGVPREGGPIGVMLAEHEIGRGCIREISKAMACLRSGDFKSVESIRTTVTEYREMLRNHIDKENNVLYPIADRLLSKDEDIKMVERFDEIERDRVGPGKHEAYHDMLHHLKEIYKA
jgi:hemerythrin-like domain-containing protein